MAIELATAYVSIVPSVRGLQGSLTRELNGATGAPAARAGQQSGSRFVGGFKKAAAAAGGLFAAAKIAGFAKDAISAASDVSESTSKVGVVFKAQAGQIITASKTSAAAMGLSSGAYLEAAGTLGNLLVSLKIAPKAAADMSQQMVKLAGDLASFNNVSPEEALAAIKSGLTGETEPLKAFGVNMNDATLHAQALKLGLIKTVKDALTPQTKALAAQALIMDQTKTAQGDFGRTSKGLANQQRILAAQFEDVKAKVGKALLPVMVKLANFVTSHMLPAFKSLGDFVKNNMTLFKVLAVAVLGVVAALTVAAIVTKVTAIATGIYAVVTGEAAAATTLQTLALGIAKARMIALSGATKAMAAVQWLLNAAMSANPIVLVVLAIAALVAGVIIAYKKIGWFRDLVQAAFRVIQTAVGVAVTAVKLILRGMYLYFVGIPLAIARIAVGMWDGIVDAIKTVYTRVKGWLGNILDFFGGIPAKIAAIAKGMWDSIGDALQTVYHYTIGPLLETIKGAIQDVKDLVDSVKAAAGTGFKIGLSGIPGFNAAGTNFWRGGPTWVGERGPELLNLPRGSKITSNSDSMAMVSDGGSQTINLVVDGRVLASVVTERNMAEARRS